MSPEKSVQSIDNNSSKTLPPEIEALRLAALSTRKTSKEKQKSENSNLPVPSSPPPKSFYTEDDSSEREEGELSDTDSIDDNKKLQLPQPTLQKPVQNVMEDITYNTNNNQQITIKMSKAEMEETTRQSISKLYNYGATPDDLIQEGIPLDVVVRFSRELNYPLPPHLFDIKIPGYPLSMPRQMEIDQPMTISNITAAAAVIQGAASNNSNLKGSSSILPSKSSHFNITKNPQSSENIKALPQHTTTTTSSLSSTTITTTASLSSNFALSQPNTNMNPTYKPKPIDSLSPQLNHTSSIMPLPPTITKSPQKQKTPLSSQRGSSTYHHHHHHHHHQSNSSPYSEKKAFILNNENSMIIELSDESDTENPQTSNHDKPVSKSEIDNDKLAKLEAKRKLEEKEREIKLMNELIATQLELINKKKGLTQSSSSSPSTPTITTTITATATANLKATSTTTTPTSPSTINPITENLAVIRAEIDAYEIAKSTVTDLKNKISSKEKEIENYQLNLHEHDNNIEKYRKQLLEINNQKNDIINKKTELQKKQTDLETQMLKIKEELSVLQENEEKLTKDEEVCQTKEKEINSSKIMLTKNINKLAEIIQNLKKDLATMNKEMISKKDKLKKLAEKMPNKQKNESSETSTTNAAILDIQSNITTINDNGKRTISSESSGNFQQQDSLMKKPKLTINQSEVDQLGKRFDELRDQNKKILENISNLNKQKNDGKISMKGVTTTNGENFQSLNTNNNLLNNNKNNNVKSSPAIRKGSNGPSNYSANNYVNQDGSLGNDDFEPLVPYASPLMAFKSFRFHPNYKELVGDYKSMTYSNSLNVQHKVCLWESHKKGRCNDFECMSQHWRQFKMNDEQVIQDMASYVEGRTPEEKEIYRAGMIKLLEDLKERGIADLEESVEAIKKYRNDFCNSHRIDDLPGPHYISFNKKFPLNHNKEVQQHDVPASPRSDTNYDYISESETSLILPPSPNLAFILDYNIDSDTNLAYQSSPNNVQMSDDNNNSDDSDDSDDNDASYIREPGSNDVSPSSSNENQLNVYQGEAQEEHTSNNLAGASYYMSTDGGFEADSENSENGNDNQNFEEPVTPDDPEPIVQQTTEPQQGGYSGLGVIGRLYNWFR